MIHKWFAEKYLLGVKHHFENDILHVDTRFNIHGSGIRALPKNIIFHYGVDLEYSNIKTLSYGLIFESYLDLHETKIEKLPNNQIH